MLVACGASEPELVGEEQSCGGTGEEAFEGEECTWSSACEVAATVDVDGPLPLVSTLAASIAPATDRSRAVRLSPDGSHAVVCELPVPMVAVELEGGGALRIATQLLPDFPSEPGCETATHFTAAVGPESTLLLPLPCPSLSVDERPAGCPATGLDATERELLARTTYDSAREAFELGHYPDALAGFLGLRALMPDVAAPLINIASVARQTRAVSCAHRDDTARALELLDPTADPLPEGRCYSVPPLLGCAPGQTPVRREEYCRPDRR